MSVRKAILLVLLLPLSWMVSAQEGNLYHLENDIYVASVDPAFWNYYRSQYKENWCWAACVQMVLNHQSVSVTQSEIVRRVYGSTYDFSADGRRIAEELDDWYVDYSTVHAYYAQYKDANTLIDALMKGVPLIVGLKNEYRTIGHAVVLVRAYFKRSGGTLSPYKVTVLDPSDRGNHEVTQYWDSFYKKINSIIYIRID